VTELTTIENRDFRFASALVSDEARMLAAIARDFVDREIMPIRREIDQDTRKDYELVEELQRKMATLGTQKANIPPEYGGLGIMPLANLCVQLEEWARGDVGFICAVGGSAWSFLPAALAGNKAILEEFAPKLCGDEIYIGCFVHDRTRWRL